MSRVLTTFSFFFWNCANGIKSKFDYVKYLANHYQPSVFFILEAEVKTTDLTVLQIQGYDLIVSETIQGVFKKARTVCYVKTDLPYKILKLDCNTHDIIGLDIGNHRFIGLYRGFKLPNNDSPNSYLQKMIGIITKLCHTNKKIFVGGDFNIDLFRRTSQLDLIEDWALNVGLDQFVNDIYKR